MAALQTIRDKAGILVSIIIGIALLAFVIGDAISSGSSILNSKRNNVGEIDGEGISVFAFQSKVNDLENAYKARTGLTVSEEMQSQLREQAWQEIVYTEVLEREAEKLGLTVSDDELFDLTYGDNISPVIYNMFGTENPAEIRSIIQYIIQTPQSGLNWTEIQNQVKFNRLFEKYMALTAGMFHTPEAERDIDLKGQTDKFDISYVVKRYSAVPDSTVNITPAAIREYYNSHPAEQEETREIVYVSFDITASFEDRQAILEEMTALSGQLAETATPENLVNINSYTKTAPAYFAQDEIVNSDLAGFIFGGNSGVFGPYEEDGLYKISRGLDKKMLPDSVRVRHIIIGGADLQDAQATADSIINDIRSGKISFDDAANENSLDRNSAVNGGDLGWLDGRTLMPQLAEKFLTAKLNTLGTVESGYGVHIYEVLEQTKPKEKIKIATIDKEIRPSATTEMAATNLARDFANGITTAEELIAKSQEMQLTRRTAILDKNDYMVNGLEDSRELVQQAYTNGHSGKIITNRDKSTVFSFGNTRRVVAALTKVNEAGIVPLEERSAQIRQILVNRQKGENMARELKAVKDNSESLFAIHNRTGLEIRDAADVTFASVQLAGAGFEPAVTGVVSTMNAGEISDPIIGNQGVYIVMVNNKTSDEITPDIILSENYRKEYMQSLKLMQELLPTLAKQANVKDYRYKFY